MEEFVKKQLELLELEREAEIEETRNLYENVPSKWLEKEGLCIRKVRVANRKTGLYGRLLVKFEPQWSGKNLPSHNMGPGDIVGVCLSSEFGHRDVIVSGVIWSTKASSVTVAFDLTSDDFSIEDQAFYCLVMEANDVTYKRLRSAMMDLKNYRHGPAVHLIEVLFGVAAPSSPLISLPAQIMFDGEVQFFNTSLDESQRRAVKFALLQKEIGIIHGPPGTGKTTALIEIIRQSVSQGLKVLACAPSNVAVDNLVEKLAEAEVKLVRLGHPARMIHANQKLSLDALITKCDNYILVKDIQHEMDGLLTNKAKFKDKGNRHQMRNEVKLLSHELKSREAAAIKEVLKMGNVILATLVSSHLEGPLKHLSMEYFDVVVIDECSQALEAACWIPLLRAPKCILAGDHFQLPPTIVSKTAAKGGLDVTLMERLLSLPANYSVVQMLQTQYRMHETIMHWSSTWFYEGKLVAAESVKRHLLRDLPFVEDNEDTSIPLLLIDTAGCDLYELELKEETSKGNEGEACLVLLYVESLMNSGIRQCDIAVTSPYNLQVEMMRTLVSPKYPAIEIKSVDGFQGREKEAIILSLTRSNLKREVGFLAEERRINVAITRARRHLAIICDSETVSHHEFLKELVDYLGSKGEVRSAHQYQNELDKLLSNTAFTHPKRNPPIKVASILYKSNMSFQKKSISKSEKALSTSNTELKTPIKNSTKDTDIQETTVKSKYKIILEEFIANENLSSYKFSASLTSFQRMQIHEVAEQLHLIHVSQGVGSERCIVISKADTSNLKKMKVAKDGIKLMKDTTTKKEPKRSSEQATAAVPQFNEIDDPSSSIKDSNNDSSDSDLLTENTVEAKHNSKPALKKKGKVPISALLKDASASDDNDLDSFFINLAKRDKTCGYAKCKVGITIRQECNFCRKAYCLGHRMPEDHGCGAEVRAHARQQLQCERGKISASNGVLVNKTKPPNRAHLEKLLDKKLTELGNKRTRKVKK